MKLIIRPVTIEHLYEVLRGLGYYSVKIDGGRSEWRRGDFHLYTLPLAKRGIKLSLHKDIWSQSPPIFAHKSEAKGKDIEQELERIRQNTAKTKAKPVSPPEIKAQYLRCIFKMLLSLGSTSSILRISCRRICVNSSSDGLFS